MGFHSRTGTAVLKELHSRPEGLTGQEVAALRKRYGENSLPKGKPVSPLVRFLRQFRDFLVLLLLGTAVLSAGISFFSPQPDWADPLIIISIVLMNAFLGTVQESRAEKAIAGLEKLNHPSARVRRDGRVSDIPLEEVVPGDILLLQAGSQIPADGRILEGDFTCHEGILTGESLPVEKDTAVCGDDTPLAERRNMVYRGCMVLTGRGEAVVTATGTHTEVGKIHRGLGEENAPMTPLQLRLARTGKQLGIGCIGICGVIFCLGMLRQEEPLGVLLTSVSLAVAAIPEGLPAIVTIVLALGVQRMAARKGIIRHLPAVETLGNTTVICTDKTGTLTQNRMTLAQSVSAGTNSAWLRWAASACNPSSADPVERAILEAAHPFQIRRLKEWPFTSKRKLSSLLVAAGEGTMLLTKGAPERLLPLCSLSEAQRSMWLETAARMAASGQRVLAAAATPGARQEENLLFTGLLSFSDPPREGVQEAVLACRAAGIRPVMLTGDSMETAIAIAGTLHIYQPGDTVLSGSELRRLEERALSEKLGNLTVCARVEPEDKVRLVKAFQARGDVVAMTGDGVNDAPALRAADIGCAMGSGTDVARMAADMVLADDSFSTLTEAVRQGRGVYANIRKAVHFLLSSNIGEIVTVLAASLLGWPSPLAAIQLLWVNLVTDSLPAVALGMDPIDPGVMEEPPRPARDSLFSGGAGWLMLVQGLLIGSCALAAYCLGSLTSPLAGSTMTFCTLSISQLLHTFNIRSDASLFSSKRLPNPGLWGTVLLGILLQTATVLVPPLRSLFRVCPLSAGQWCITGGLCLVPLAAAELGKLLHFCRHEKSRPPRGPAT